MRLDVNHDIDGHAQQPLDNLELQPGTFIGGLHHERELVPGLFHAACVAAGD